MNHTSKKLNRILLLVLAAAMVLGVCLALTACKPEEQTGPSEPVLYWNVEGKEYRSGKYTRMASSEDGYVYMLFTKDGEQLRLPVKDTLLATKIDMLDCMGLVFDENGVVVDAVRVEEFTGGYAVNNYIVEAVDGTKITTNSSGILDGHRLVIDVPEGTPVWNISGTGITVGIPWVIGVDDKIIAINDKDGKLMCVYTEAYTPPQDIYWNVKRMYDSNAKISTRLSEPSGGYLVTLACNGEVKDYRVRESNIVNQMDAMAAKCFALEFDEEGYVVGVTHAGSATGGGSTASWYHCIGIDGMYAEFERMASGSNIGAKYTGMMGKDVKVFNVSGTGEYIGEPTELKVGDQVHCLLDSRNRLAVIFVVNRRVESEIYWNVERKWDSKAAKTTRSPDADGWYNVLVAVRGEQITVKTKDWEIANSIDGRAAKCFGLKLDENNVIQKFYTPDAAKGATFASWYDITALDGNNIELVKASNGDVKKGRVAADCEVYDVSPTAVKVGEITELQVGDRVHTLKALNGDINVAFVVNRYVDWPIYYNLDRKWSDTTKSTTRKPDADGYYVFRMAVDGEEVTLKTKSKNVANAIDKEVAKCLTMSVDQNGIIYKAMHASNATICKGGATSSWATVTSVSKTGFTTHKSTGKDYNEKYAWNAKAYNVSTNFVDHQGEQTKLQVGDFVHCLMNRRGEVTYVAVMTRFIEADVYYNLDQKWNSSKGESTRVPDADGVYSIQMAYGGKEVTVKTTDPEVVYNIDKEVAKCVGLLFDENGYCIFATHAKNTEYCRGGIGMSYATVTEVDGNKVTVTKDGKLTTFTISDDCEMFVTLDTEGLTRGNYTTVRVGDFVHCLKDADGNTNYMVIMSRVKQLPKVDHTCQHITEDVTWYEWDGDGFPKSGHYVLTKDIEMDKRVTVDAGVEITLCLNGHTVTSTDRVFNTYGTINICDHKVDGKYDGKITSSYSGSSYGAISYMYNNKGNANFNIYGGTLEHTGSLSSGGLFFLGQTSTSGYTATLNIYDGTLTGGKTTGTGAGLAVSNGSIVNMYGGTITGCVATGNGGGMRIDSGKFNMTGGVVEGNKAAEGGNISIGSGGVANISEKAIVRDGIATNGANVQVIGKFNLTDGGKLSGGTVTGQGTAISAFANAASAHAVVLVDNATIEGTVRLDTGAGPVDMTVIDSKVTGQIKVGVNSCTLTVGGKVDLAEVRLLDGKVITIHENGLDDASSIAVAMENCDKAFATITDANDEDCFKPADPAIYKLVNDNNDLYLESTVKPHKHCACNGDASGKPNHTCSTTEYLPWSDPNALPASGKYYLTTDVSITKTTEIKASLDLCLNGHEIKGTTRIYKIYSTFNLSDCAAKNSDGSYKGKLIGNQTSTTLGPVFYVYSGGTFNLFGGELTVSSTSKTAQAGVGGIQVGTMNMYGGKISGGNVTGKGGCLSIFDKAVVNLYGGEISGGKAVGAGGNIYLSKGTLNIYDGATVSGGYTEATGGNIFCDTSADNHLLIKGGLITGGKTVATSDKSGGNLDIRCADAKILGGIIEKGYAYEGGNIRAGNNAKLIIGGNAIIRDGEAKTSGGNIALFATLTIQDDAKISGGKATGGDGGNISAFANLSTATVNLTITGGKISGGTAKTNAGSIRLSGKDGTVNAAFLGGEIEKGTAPNYLCVMASDIAGMHVTIGGDAKIFSLGLVGNQKVTISTDKPLVEGADIGLFRANLGVLAENVTTDITQFVRSTGTGKVLGYDPDAQTLVLETA